MSHKNSDFQTASRSVDSTGLFLAGKKMEECFIFTHCGNFQALKVCDLKFSNVSQLCDLKNQIIKVGI
jgi:hypothetical protein